MYALSIYTHKYYNFFIKVDMKESGFDLDKSQCYLNVTEKVYKYIYIFYFTYIYTYIDISLNDKVTNFTTILVQSAVRKL